MFDDGCSGTVNTKIQLGAGAFGYQIKMKQNEPNGYTTKICVECETVPGRTTTYDEYELTQIMDCSIALSNKPTVSEPTISHSFSPILTEIVGQSFTDFFDNADPKNCGITSCSIGVKTTCAALPPSSRITLATNAITAAHDVYGGYDETICV